MDHTPDDVLMTIVEILITSGEFGARATCSVIHEAYTLVIRTMLVIDQPHHVKCRVVKLCIALNGCMTLTPVKQSDVFGERAPPEVVYATPSCVDIHEPAAYSFILAEWQLGGKRSTSCVISKDIVHQLSRHIAPRSGKYVCIWDSKILQFWRRPPDRLLFVNTFSSDAGRCVKESLKKREHNTSNV